MGSIHEKYAAALSESNDAVLQRSLFIIHGGALSGKTCLGMTISEQCPPLPSEKPVTITDTAHFGIDRGAADSLPGVGINCKHYIDFNKLLALCSGNPIEASNAAVQIVAGWPVKNVIVDTLSMFLTHTTTYYEGRPSDFMSKGSFDGQMFYRKVLTVGKDFYKSWASLPMNVVFLSHTKVDAGQFATGTGAERAKLEAAAQGPGGAGKLELDIVGASQKLLINESSIIASLDVTKPTMGGAAKRELILEDPSEMYQVKNRFGAFLNKREPANLLAMVNKIKAGISSRMAVA